MIGASDLPQSRRWIKFWRIRSRPVTRPRGILGSRFWTQLGVWNATLSVPRASQIRPHRRERRRSSTCLDRLVQAEPSSRASCRLLAPPVLRCLSRSRFSWSDFQSHSPFEVCSSYSAGCSASASGSTRDPQRLPSIGGATQPWNAHCEAAQGIRSRRPDPQRSASCRTARFSARSGSHSPARLMR